MVIAGVASGCVAFRVPRLMTAICKEIFTTKL